MGTKLSELSPKGCFARAKDDEPMFVLLARDPSAPDLVEDWAKRREAEVTAGRRPASDLAQVKEARESAQNMRAWRDANDGMWREGMFAQGRTSHAVELPEGESAPGVLVPHARQSRPE